MPQILAAAAVVVKGVVSAVAAFGTAIGAASAGASTLTAAIQTVATIGSIAQTAIALTKTPDPPSHNPASVVIGANAPTPYCMGRTYIGGHTVHDAAFGPRRDKIDNPNRTMIFVDSIGPIHRYLNLQTDHAVAVTGERGTPTGYYANYMGFESRRGTHPDTALGFDGYTIPNWGPNHKLSGLASSAVFMTLDKKGEIYSGGVPKLGKLLEGVLVYDPRLDSTYPGGSGSCRARQESTYVYSENPALHALTYAIGRFQNGKKVFGPGIEIDGIDVPAFVEAANVSDLNGWKIGGTIYEPGSPGQVWNNIKLILQACSARPSFKGGLLSCHYDGPRVSATTVTRDDLSGEECEVPGTQSFRDKINTVIPKFRSEAHNWEYVPASEVTNADYLAQDGEPKTREIQYTLCQSQTQAAQLAAYDLVNARELGPVKISCKPRMREYGPGEAVTLDLPELGLSGLFSIVSTTVNTQNSSIELVLFSDTIEKHDYALGRSTVTPEPTGVVLSEDIDGAAAGGANRINENLITTSWVDGLSVTAMDAGSDATISISAHSRVYSDSTVSLVEGSITGQPFDTDMYIYYDDPERDGKEFTYQATSSLTDAVVTDDNPARHYIGQIRTPVDGGEPTTGITARPPTQGPLPEDVIDIAQQAIDNALAEANAAIGEVNTTLTNALANIDSQFFTVNQTVGGNTQSITAVQQSVGTLSGQVAQLQQVQINPNDFVSVSAFNNLHAQINNGSNSLIARIQTLESAEVDLSGYVTVILHNQLVNMVNGQSVTIQSLSTITQSLESYNAQRASLIVGPNNTVTGYSFRQVGGTEMIVNDFNIFATQFIHNDSGQRLFTSTPQGVNVLKAVTIGPETGSGNQLALDNDGGPSSDPWLLWFGSASIAYGSRTFDNAKTCFTVAGRSKMGGVVATPTGTTINGSTPVNATNFEQYFNLHDTAPPGGQIP